VKTNYPLKLKITTAFSVVGLEPFSTLGMRNSQIDILPIDDNDFWCVFFGHRGSGSGKHLTTRFFDVGALKRGWAQSVGTEISTI
jgi:hypothetical protein